MGSTSILVSLKAPDPAAMTALSTLKRISPAIAPDELMRFDHWCFEGPGADRELVSLMVSHYTDIVNPNKQTWRFFEGTVTVPKSDPETIRTSVLVTDRVDSVSENWTGILGRKYQGVTGVRYSVLWHLVFRDVTPDEARRRTMTLAVTSRRDSGLLANPVSQEITLLGTGKT